MSHPPDRVRDGARRPPGCIHDCVRERRIAAPVDLVWRWLLVPRHVFLLNVFHVDAACDAERVHQGLAVGVRHRLGLATQERVARVTRCEPYRLAWGELREDGKADFFPHSQSLELEPTGPAACRVRNHLRGRIVLPAARWWFVPLYRRLAPRILDAENLALARAVEGRSG